MLCAVGEPAQRQAGVDEPAAACVVAAPDVAVGGAEVDPVVVWDVAGCEGDVERELGGAEVGAPDVDGAVVECEVLGALLVGGCEVDGADELDAEWLAEWLAGCVAGPEPPPSVGAARGAPLRWCLAAVCGRCVCWVEGVFPAGACAGDFASLPVARKIPTVVTMTSRLSAAAMTAGDNRRLRRGAPAAAAHRQPAAGPGRHADRRGTGRSGGSGRRKHAGGSVGETGGHRDGDRDERHRARPLVAQRAGHLGGRRPQARVGLGHRVRAAPATARAARPGSAGAARAGPAPPRAAGPWNSLRPVSASSSTSPRE